MLMFQPHRSNITSNMKDLHVTLHATLNVKEGEKERQEK